MFKYYNHEQMNAFIWLAIISVVLAFVGLGVGGSFVFYVFYVGLGAICAWFAHKISMAPHKPKTVDNTHTVVFDWNWPTND